MSYTTPGVRPSGRTLYPVLLIGGIAGSAACGGLQSTLAPAGTDAARIFNLTVVMTIGAALIWAAVVGLSVYATRARGGRHKHLLARHLIIGGGAVFPFVVLSTLLVYGLSALPPVLALPGPGGIVIAVTGEQWWWRVRYLLPDGRAFDLANEVRLPIGERIEVHLQSADVIHSFWIPSLAGKMDMVPGRLNRIALEPTRTGIFRGACAEYCGTSHARMNFFAVVETREDFAKWVEAQFESAAAPGTPLAVQGRDHFLASGCGACHTVRGTEARGTLGPDLTHVASRISIGAGMLPTHLGDFQRWIEVTERVKPGVHMPSFNMLPPADVRAMATFLSGLR